MHNSLADTADTAGLALHRQQSYGFKSRRAVNKDDGCSYSPDTELQEESHRPDDLQPEDQQRRNSGTNHIIKLVTRHQSVLFSSHARNTEISTVQKH